MTKYTDEQLRRMYTICSSPSEPVRQRFINYLRSEEFKADTEAGFWDEPLDPIEQARREAREIAAQYWDEYDNHIAAAKYRKGHCDNTPRFQGAFAALCQERGLEVPE